MKIIVVPEYWLLGKNIIDVDYRKSAIISVMSPDVDRRVDLTQFKEVLKLDFYDYELRHMREFRQDNIFTDEMADQVWNFVSNLGEDIEALVIHCEAGVSRSPAIGYALHVLSDRLELARFFGCPNDFVFCKMVEAYKRWKLNDLAMMDEIFENLEKYVEPDNYKVIDTSWVAESVNMTPEAAVDYLYRKNDNE